MNNSPVKIKFYRAFSKKLSSSDWQAVKSLLLQCSDEFKPPLTSRHSTKDTDFIKQVVDEKKGSIDPYFNSLKNQDILIARIDNQICAFMSFNSHATPAIKNAMKVEQERDFLYISTICVDKYKRRLGICSDLYNELIRRFGDREIVTRTWHTNKSHLDILHYYGFYYCNIIRDDRGKGLDTVYLRRKPIIKTFWGSIKQYQLTNNIYAVLLFTVLSMLAIWLWWVSGEGIIKELHIAFATAFITTVAGLCLDTYFRYRESRADNFISHLSDFGVKDVRFEKEELIQSLLHRGAKNVSISGYRLISTSKQNFIYSLKQAAKKQRNDLTIRLLLVQPDSDTYKLVYGDEDSSKRHESVFKALKELHNDYDCKIEVRYTEKPIFNDTYIVDNHIISGPYLHSLRTAEEYGNKKVPIEAKDFYALHVDDPSKELHKKLRGDYDAVWDAAEVYDYIEHLKHLEKKTVK